MAREHARLYTSIWNDPDFLELTPEDQRGYIQLLSQRNVSQAGVLPLQVRKLTKGSKHTTEEDVWKYLHSLADARFIVIDEDTEEVLIRSFIRRDGVLKIPNVFKSALRAATNVESPKLRSALARELRRLDRKDAAAVAEQLEPNPSSKVPEPIGNQSGTNPKQGIGNPSGTNGEPVETESGTRKGSLKVPNEIPEPPGEGEGEGEISCLVDGWVGGSPAGAPAGAHTREAPTPQNPQPEQRPAERCTRHVGVADPPPCRACATAREARERFDADQARAAVEARQAEARRAAADKARAIAGCGMCDDSGYVGAALCHHDPDAAERAARGRAAVQAALSKRDNQEDS